jgi:NADH dehydrogenase
MPSAVILRPSIVFGAEDAFFNRFAGLTTFSPALPLIGGGHTRFQPVYVGDVAAAVARVLGDPAAAGRVYELGGPTVYSFRDLLAFILRETGRSRLLVPVPWFAAKILGAVGDLQAAVPIIPPQITSDQVESLRADNVVSEGAAGLAELGIEPRAVEAIVPSYLYRFRKGGQYAATPEGAI